MRFDSSFQKDFLRRWVLCLSLLPAFTTSIYDFFPANQAQVRIPRLLLKWTRSPGFSLLVALLTRRTSLLEGWEYLVSGGVNILYRGRWCLDMFGFGSHEQFWVYAVSHQGWTYCFMNICQEEDRPTRRMMIVYQSYRTRQWRKFQS